MNKFILALLCAFTINAVQPGTTPVTAPVAPPAPDSNFGGSDSKYQTGGLQEWFQNANDWTNTSILPNGRKRVGMLVSAGSGTFYRLMSMSPDVWSPFQPGGGGSLTNGFGLGMTFSNTTLQGWTVISGSVTNTGDWVYNSGSITYANLTANTILGLNGSKGLVSVAVTPTELLSLQGISGNIQTNFNARQPTITGAASSITTLNLTPNRAMITDASGKAWQSTVTATELASLTGINGNVQTNIDNRVLRQPWGGNGQIALLSSSNGLSGWYTPNDVTNVIVSIVNQALGNIGGTTNAVYVPTTMYDIGNTINTNTPAVKTAFFQSYIDLANTLYDTNIGAVHCVFQPGRATFDGLTLKSHIIYQALGDFNHHRATDGGAGGQRSMWYTERTNGVTLYSSTVTHVSTFDSWILPNADQWYGNTDDIQVAGPGRFILHADNRIITQPIVYLNEVRNFVVEDNVLVVNTGPYVTNWSIRMGGRNVYMGHVRVNNGVFTGQDGCHITHGRNIVINGGFFTSGDDSIPCGNEINGLSNVAPDEPLSDVYILNPYCDSTSARAFVAYSGPNLLNIPYTNGGLEVKRIYARDLFGTVAKMAQTGIIFSYYWERDKIYKYRVDAPGSGYTDGYYTCAVGNVGGGSGASCVVKVEGGVITDAYPYWNGGASWSIGSGYKQFQAVNLAPLPVGTGGSVTALLPYSDNTKVTDVDLTAKLTIGGPNHANVNHASPFVFHGASRIKVDMSATIIESTNAPHARPIRIWSGQDLDIRLVINSKCTSGGEISSGTYPGDYVDNVYIHDSNFGQCDGDGVIRIRGTNGTIILRNNTFRDIPDSHTAIKFGTFTGAPSFTTNLYIDGNTFRALSPAGTGTSAFTVNNDLGTAGIDYLHMHDNNLGNTVAVPAQSTWAPVINHWSIYDNWPLMISRNSQLVTFNSGVTNVTVTVGTTTGLTGTNEIDLRNINFVPLNNPTTPFTGEPWITTNGTISSLVFKLPNDPGASGARFMFNIDTGKRP